MAGRSHRTSSPSPGSAPVSTASPSLHSVAASAPSVTGRDSDFPKLPLTGRPCCCKQMGSRLNHGRVTVVSVAWCLAGPGNARWNSARVCQRFDSPRLRYIESGRRFGLRGSSCQSDRVWIWPSEPSASARASRLQMLDFYFSSFETDSPRLRPTAKASH